MRPQRFLTTLIVVLSLIVIGAQFCRAQAPDCHLARRMYDDPLPGVHGWLPRYQWHVTYATLSSATAYTLHRTTRLSPMQASVVSTVLIGVLPHVLGVVTHKPYTFPINARDWLFDAWSRSTPVWFVLTRRTHTLYPATTYIAGYFALACYASP